MSRRSRSRFRPWPRAVRRTRARRRRSDAPLHRPGPARAAWRVDRAALGPRRAVPLPARWGAPARPRWTASRASSPAFSERSSRGILGWVTAYRHDAAPHCTRCTARLELVRFGEDGEALCTTCATQQQVVRDDRTARVPMLTVPQVALLAFLCVTLLFASVYYALSRRGDRGPPPTCGQEICS